MQYFLHSVLSHYSSIPLSNRYGTGFTSHVLPLLLYCALWLLLLVWLSIVRMLQAVGTRPAFLFLQPRSLTHFQFDCLQCVKQTVASCPDPGYNSPIPNHCPSPNTFQCRNTGVLIHSSHVHAESAGHWTLKIVYWRSCISISVFSFWFRFQFPIPASVSFLFPAFPYVLGLGYFSLHLCTLFCQLLPTSLLITVSYLSK